MVGVGTQQRGGGLRSGAREAPLWYLRGQGCWLSGCCRCPCGVSGGGGR